MTDADRERIQDQNSMIRGKLTKMGVPCEERRPNESLEEENRRLSEQLRWYLELLNDVGRGT